MRLTFTDPQRPQDQFVINDRTDGDPLVHEGETFEVPAARGRELLAAYHPRLQPAEGKPGSKANPIVVATVKEKQPKRARAKTRATKTA